MSSELIERLREKNEWTNQKPYFHAHPKSLEAADLIEAQAATIAQLQAELAEARGNALEEAAQEAEKWFPANSAAKYPTGGIAAAIRAMKS